MVIGSGRESFGIHKIPDEKKYTQSAMVQTHNAALRTEKAFRVTISEEGAKSYRDSLHNFAEYKAAAYDERSELIDIMSKSVVDIAGEIESDLHLRYTGLNTEAGGEKCGAGDFAGNLLKAYTDIYQEIKKGYADGTREIWTADNSAENGYRKVTEEEELAALDKAMDFHTMTLDAYLNSGKEEGWKAREAVERTWAEIENRKYEQRSYQKEEETDHMYEKLKKAVDSIKDRYEVHKGDLTYLVDQVMKENWQVNFKGGLTV